MIAQLTEQDNAVLVTGDRHWDDLERVYQIISKYPPNVVFIHGYADGLDCCVDVIASELGYKVICCPAHWNHDAERWVEVYGHCPPDCSEIIGRPAGVLRNKWMLDQFFENIIEVIGFHNSIAISRGTKDMLKRAQKAGKPTTLYTSFSEIENPVLTKLKNSVKIKSRNNPDQFFDWG